YHIRRIPICPILAGHHGFFRYIIIWLCSSLILHSCSVIPTREEGDAYWWARGSWQDRWSFSGYCKMIAELKRKD
ncbi:hypothetical protein ACFL6S_31660, partial [Candidatus Poribacteria bacterium]